MKLSEISEIIEKDFPLADAYEWDNSGLLIGDKDRDIKSVLLSLDVSQSVVREAITVGADLILSHHPILFGGTKRITSDTPEGKTLMMLLENKICVYSAHTNCDIGKNGINARLAELFNLSDVEFLEPDGLGRIGTLEKAVSFVDFLLFTKKVLNTPFVRFCGDKASPVSRIAVASGACADSIPTAVKKGADVIITADLKYHDMLNYSEQGIFIIDAGHYPTEIIVTDIFYSLLSKTDLKLIKSKSQDIFNYI